MILYDDILCLLLVCTIFVFIFSIFDIFFKKPERLMFLKNFGKIQKDFLCFRKFEKAKNILF